MMEGNEKNIRWYVMQVMSGHELRVFKKICFDCSADAANVVGEPAEDDYDVKFNGLFSGIYEVNIPYELVQGKRDANGRRGKDTKKKLYPGYVLLKAELYDGNNTILIPNLEYVKNVKSVIGLIGGMYPTPLTDDEAARMMRQQQDNDEHKVKPVIQFNIGENVVVNSGNFAGVEGTIESIDQEHQRLKLLVNIFGRYTQVDLDCGQVERP